MASSSEALVDGLVNGRSVGVLTKTVIRSPVVRWLLPARLRHKSLRDLVFVGDDYIQVKQVGDEGHLEHVATKDDFDARIRAAKVFSIDPEPLEEDLLIKVEDEPPVSGSTFAPSDLLALTLETDDLVFLYLTNNGDGRFHFVQQSCPLPTFDCALFQPGEHLAVDPHARAVAVAANEREVVIYSAKTAERINSELRSGNQDWCPISVPHFLQVQGVIQHVDFLIPPPDDEDHIILLLIVVDQRKTKAIWIDWYCTSDIHHAQIHPGQPLDSAKTVSSLLIPLRNAAFMIITGNDVRLWKNILTGSVTGEMLDPLEAEPKNSGASPRLPVWASWCRPRRSRAATRDKDYLYLVREDGLVYLVHVASETLVSSSAGHLDCHVGTAFASLGDTEGPDILAVAGDMSTGRVVSMGHFPKLRVSELSWSDTMKMEVIETIPNWASATDMISTTLRYSQGKSSRSVQSAPGTFVTSGRQPYGSITELRHGLEARMSTYFPLDGMESVTEVWAIPIVPTGSVLLFLTYPSATRLISMCTDDEGFVPEEIGASDCPAFDLTQPTLAAALLADGRIVQVTRQGVAVTVGLSIHFEDSFKRVCANYDHIVAAAIESSQCAVITAERRGESHFICSTRFLEYADGEMVVATAPSYRSGESIRELDSAPTALAAYALPYGILAAVGSTDGHLSIFKIARNNTIQEVCRTRMPSFQDAPGVCGHLVMLQSDNSASLLAVCGLRDGRLHAIVLESTDADSYSRGTSNTTDFGHTAVKLVSLPNNRSQACAMSSADTCLLSWSGGEAHSLVISNIWISDKSRPELAQGPVIAVTQMPESDYLDMTFQVLADSLVIVCADSIFMTDIQTSPTTVPRQLPVTGTPSRLLYAEQQKCFVVASTWTDIRSFPTPYSRPEERRQIWPTIDFIPSQSDKRPFKYDLQPGERVYALLEWSVKLDDRKKHCFVLVGGTRLRSDRSQGGRITFMQPINRDWEVVDVKVHEGSRGTKKFDAPVYALALFDELTYVVCYGRYVMLYRFLVSERRWEEVCTPYKLASEGVFVTVVAPLIYISTLADSLVTLRLQPGQSVHSGEQEDGSLSELVPVSMGPQAHDSLSHVVLQPDTSQALALLSTKRGQLIGLTSPRHTSDTQRHSADILFEARLPRSLTRVRQSDTRPKWKPASPSGVLVDNIIGTATDGTLVGIALLDDKLWRRLSWLQRLCKWSKHLSPHSYQTSDYNAMDIDHVRDERALPIGLSTTSDGRDESVLRTVSSRPEDMHIDGDILARLLERGGTEALRQMIQQAAEREDGVGEWVRQHLDAELAAVNEMIDLLPTLLDRWI